MDQDSLKSLLVFARQLEHDAPPQTGVRHLTLRALANELIVADLIEWIAEGEFEMAQEELTGRLQTAAGLLRQLDALLAVPSAPAPELADQAICARLSSVLDRVITPRSRDCLLNCSAAASTLV